MNTPLPSGSQLKGGIYRVQKFLKIGGQAIVYEGINVESGLQVIIKQNCEEQESFHEVIRQEASLLSSLEHPSLPRALDCFSESGCTFLVMSLVPGHDVSDLMKKRDSPFTLIEVLGWANQLLDILEYLQARSL